MIANKLYIKGQFISLFIILVSVLSIDAYAQTYKIDEIIADLELINCSNDICIQITVKNDIDEPICIDNGFLPYDGQLGREVFRITELETKDVVWPRETQPSFSSTNPYARLVRLFPIDGVGETTIYLYEYYDIDINKSYQIEYRARAYLCDKFEDKGYILVNGQVQFN